MRWITKTGLIFYENPSGFAAVTNLLVMLSGWEAASL